MTLGDTDNTSAKTRLRQNRGIWVRMPRRSVFYDSPVEYNGYEILPLAWCPGTCQNDISGKRQLQGIHHVPRSIVGLLMATLLHGTECQLYFLAIKTTGNIVPCIAVVLYIPKYLGSRYFATETAGDTLCIPVDNELKTMFTELSSSEMTP